MKISKICKDPNRVYRCIRLWKVYKNKNDHSNSWEGVTKAPFKISIT